MYLTVRQSLDRLPSSQVRCSYFLVISEAASNFQVSFLEEGVFESKLDVLIVLNVFFNMEENPVVIYQTLGQLKELVLRERGATEDSSHSAQDFLYHVIFN